MQKTPVSSRLAQLRIRHLTLLDSINDCKSLSKVAETLCITQPAVTAMLRELESVLQVQLVDRDRQGARLTAIGTSVLRRMREATNCLQGLESGLMMAQGLHHLRVGVLTSALLKLVPNAVAKLRNQQLPVTFQFFEKSLDDVINGILDHSLDCGVGRIGTGTLQSATSELLSISQLENAPLKIIGAAQHPLCGKRRVSLKQLQDFSWILLPQETQSRMAFDQAFIQEGLVPPLPVVESFSFYSNFHLASKTDLLTISPETSLEHFAAANIVRPVNIDWPIGLSPFMFFSLKERANSDVIIAFKNALLSSAK